MNLTAYWQRIGYEGQAANAATLAQIQQAHLFAFPFENLDIHYNTPIVCAYDAMYNKLINLRRGGFCYEQNGLLHQVLTQLGFEVAQVNCRVWREKSQEYSPDFDHMALLVTINQTVWLADVGFGAVTFSPLNLSHSYPQTNIGGTYRVLPMNGLYVIEKEVVKEGLLSWEAEYRFEAKPWPLSAFEARCHYQQTSPQSHFTQKRLISLPKVDGTRHTITGDVYKVSKAGDTLVEKPIANEAEFKQLLADVFHVTYPGTA